VFILGALALLLAQELTQNDRNSLYQILGLMVTGAFGALAAFLGSKGGRSTDKTADAIKKASTGEFPRVSVGSAQYQGVPMNPGTASLEMSGGNGGNGNLAMQSWRDLSREWQDRYREESEAHDEALATIAELRAENRRLRSQLPKRRQGGGS
jgi:hypothetical protein